MVGVEAQVDSQADIIRRVGKLLQLTVRDKY
jgi:hypothetical protein